MKATLEFNIDDYDDKDMYNCAVKGQHYRDQIEEIYQRVFRPNRKHGYDNPILDDDKAYDIIEELFQLYQSVIQEE